MRQVEVGNADRLRPVKRAYFSALNAAIDRAVLPGDHSYVRFIVLGSPRTGSTSLVTALRSHSRIIDYGELFKVWRDEDVPRWPNRFGLRTKARIETVNSDPQRYLSDCVFRTYPQQIQAVGFKIFYEHAQSPKWRPIWHYLKDQRNIRVVHVKRKNLLRTHLSFELAQRTGRYRSSSPGASSPPPDLRLEYEDCLRAFSTLAEQQRRFDADFADHALLEVSYEALASDFDGQVRTVQDFLGVTHESVRPETRKQEKRPLASAIQNYNELKARFAGSEWEPLFEE